jgi:hypothetical protein
MAAVVLTRPATSVQPSPAPVDPSPRAAIGWLAGGAAVMFAASLIAGDLGGLHHDLYLLVDFTVALGYLGWFATKCGVARGRLLRTNLWWSLGVGVLVGAAVVRQVMSQGGTGHPTGGYFGFELAWRGVVYGSVDALVLAVFPTVVAYLVLRGNRKGPARKAAFAGLVVVFSLMVSAAYHAGYSTYRSSTMSKPLTGTIMWDIPAVLTGSPAGAVVAHAAVHTSAVVHQYYGGDNHLLPPELTADYPERGGGVLGALIAAGWLLLVTGVLLVSRDRWLPPLRAQTEPSK